MADPAIRLTVGGDVQANRGTYLTRPEDEQLLEACLTGQFAYVLACRQIGKSSLKNAVAQQLTAQGIRVARIDLNRIGWDVEKAEDWYFSLLDDLARCLGLETDVEIWWDRQPRLSGFARRFLRFLDEVVLTEISVPVVVFVDEIDMTLGLPFTDDFFAAIRVVYNDRAQDPAYQRLTFVLLGVATPDELINDPNRTPFNIGRTVPMRDFTQAECAPLRLALEAKQPGQSQAYFQRIYEWTNGHPYLTQKLCAAIVKAPPTDDPDLVDNLVRAIFLTGDPTEVNLHSVQTRVLGDPYASQMLRIYESILQGKTVLDDEKSLAINRLKLSGLIVAKNGRLKARNKIYTEVFNLAWIEDHASSRLPRFYVSIKEWLPRWLEVLAANLFGTYRRTYCQHLIYRHRVFDVKGLTTQGIYSLELERVFVELSVVPQPLHHTSADPIRQVPAELRKGRRVIWDYLQSEQTADQNLAIIGPPGCGKTTLLQNMTLVLAAGKKHRRQVNAPEKLPLLLFLRNHAQDIQTNPDVSLPQVVRNSLAKWTVKAPPGWFESQLAKGRCLVMLDGLDEIADPAARMQVVEWIERQMVAYAKNRFVITSRPYGYRTNPLSGVTVLEVRPFTSDQVRRFVHNWYLANEVMSAQKDDPGVRMAAEEGAEDLLRRLPYAPDLSAMAVNPLLLTMIATIHRYRSSLPRRRVELYAEICDVFMGTRQQARGLPPALGLTPAQKQRVLQPLAYHMMCKQQVEIPLVDALKVIAEPLTRVTRHVFGEDFLKTIENTSGLLLERENGVYSFATLTLQEYLAAAHIREGKLENDLVVRVEDSWWHETIRLYVAQADATPIVAACLVSDPPSVPALTLAIECMEEARGVLPNLRERLETVLDQGIEDPNPERRRIVAEALLALRLRRMVRVDEDKYIDNSLVTHAEYQLFLDARRALGKYHQPDHWLDNRFPAGQGRAPILGVRPSDALAFCEWLTQRESGGWIYRLPNPGELDTYDLVIESLKSQDGKDLSTLGGILVVKERVHR